MSRSEYTVIGATRAEARILSRLRSALALMEAEIRNRQNRPSLFSNAETTAFDPHRTDDTLSSLVTPETPAASPIKAISRLSQLVRSPRRSIVRHSNTVHATPIKDSQAIQSGTPRLRWISEQCAAESRIRAHILLRSYVVIKPIKIEASSELGQVSPLASLDTPLTRTKANKSTATVVQAREKALANLLSHCTPGQVERYYAADIKPDECHLWPVTQSCSRCLKYKHRCLSRILGGISNQKSENCIKCFIVHQRCDEHIKASTRRLQREVVTIDDLEAMNP